ncbi:MAG: ABC transporter permease [Eubacteriaceae bacterium]|jgi:putative ABC transport system permease protein|nr:ABC transporter permease [Eubacteriaceae bacterium]
MFNLLISTVTQGLFWAILALGVYITYRVLDVADLSVEGTFPLGAAVTASLITVGVNPFLALLAATIAGMLGGAATGIFHTKLKIPALLSGILTMIGMYSVNLRIMGKANLPMLGSDTVITLVQGFGLSKSIASLLLGFIFVVAVAVWMYWFFGTELGMAIRATGFNPQMIRAQGVNTDQTIMVGLVLANGLVGLAGGFIAQNNGFADVGMGIGTIVIGLASVIIGEVLFGVRSFKNSLISVILGSVVYRMVIALVLQMGLKPDDLKLFTALLVALALSMPLIQEKLRNRKGNV